MTLHPHQLEAIAAIQRSFQDSQSFLLADDTGIGKSRVACQIARQTTSTDQVLIAAPLSTHGGWLQEASVIGLEAAVAGIMWPSTKAVIVNYERLDKYKEIGAWMNGKQELFEASPFSLVIGDEAQKLKSYTSKRFKIWKGICKRARRILYLTATPGQDPMELRYLADVIGIKDSLFWNWVRQFKGIWKPQWGGLKFRPGHLEDTQKLLKITQNNPRALRRTAKDIVGWPELQRIIQPVRLTAREGHDYGVAFEDYLQAISEANKTIHPQSHRLVASGQFRKRLSEIKVPYTVDLAKNLLEQGKVVTISCEYRETVRLIYNELEKDYRVSMIHGDVSTEERQAILAKSKCDELDVVIFTVQEGINLHQTQDSHISRVQIDSDIRWSALAMHQIDGRTHRAGVHAPVYWMTCHEAIDHKVAIRLKERMETLGAINGELEPIDFLA